MNAGAEKLVEMKLGVRPEARCDRVEADRHFIASSEIVLYDGAPHAFSADYRPSYRKEAGEDGWKRMQDWLKKHGVA